MLGHRGKIGRKALHARAGLPGIGIWEMLLPAMSPLAQRTILPAGDANHS